MMKLIADCGSSKVEWAIINGSSEEPIKVIRTTGFNAAVTPSEEILQILSSQLAPEIVGFEISEVHFYGAGCIGGKTDETLRKLLSQFIPDAKIEIASDLLAAARSLFSDYPGVACILGTGSNCGLYNGTEIVRNIAPLGYILGDEGSGTHIGKSFLNLLLRNPEKLPNDILNDFQATYHLTNADIINRVYRQPGANRFLASFAPFIKKHIKNDVIFQLVKDCIWRFFMNSISSFNVDEGISAKLPEKSIEGIEDLKGRIEEIVDAKVTFDGVSLTKNDYDLSDTSLPIGFVGSIAYNFSDVIIDIAEYDYMCDAPKILQSPLPNLLRYHAHH